MTRYNKCNINHSRIAMFNNIKQDKKIYFYLQFYRYTMIPTKVQISDENDNYE